MDKIKINNMEIFANHGVFEEEKKLGQKFIISATLFTEFPQDDNIEQAINYADVCMIIKRVVTGTNFDLIESLATAIAKSIITEYKKVKKISVEVKKPWAPIMENLEYVSVTKELSWHKALLGIGSNMGNREENLNKAVDMIEEDSMSEVVKTSSYINTSPVGGVEQDDFLNGALVVNTLRTPYELLDFIGTIENELKRVRTIHWGPRTIDVDILMYDDIIMSDDKLTIPHMYMHKREFVLRPLSEIVPGAYNPVTNKTVIQMLNELTGRED